MSEYGPHAEDARGGNSTAAGFRPAFLHLVWMLSPVELRRAYEATLPPRPPRRLGGACRWPQKEWQRLGRMRRPRDRRRVPR